MEVIVAAHTVGRFDLIAHLALNISSEAIAPAGRAVMRAIGHPGPERPVALVGIGRTRPRYPRAVNGVHDMGGSRGHGMVVIEQDEPVFHHPWEGRVRGMMQQLIRAGVFNLDEFRHAQERLLPDEYLRSGYYERWLAAIELLIREKGLELQRKGLPETRAQPRFKPGDHVITKSLNPPGHTRLPRYARAKRGVIESFCGPYLLPDTNAHQRSRDWEPVYTVVFSARELWGDQADMRQSVSIDLWQRYLEAQA